MEAPGWSRTQRITLAATGLGLFLVYLDVLIVNVALPDIQQSFDVGEAGIQWVVTAYSLGMAAFIMSSATLADRLGRRKLYIASLMVFSLSSVAGGLAPGESALVAARFVQGMAGATVNVTSLALVSAAFTASGQKAKAVGIWTAIGAVGTVLGPTVGGFLVDGIGWRSVFFVNVPVAIVAAVLASRFVAESRDPAHRSFDGWGQLLFIVAIGGLTFGVIQGQPAGWTSVQVLSAFALGALSLVIFVVVELRGTQPMMDLRLFANRTYRASIIIIFGVFVTFYGMLLLVTQYFQNVRGYRAADAGLLLMPEALAIAVLSPFVGRITARLGARTPVLVGQATLAVAFVLLAVALPFGGPAVALTLILVGTGTVSLLVPITSLAMSAVPAGRAGMASGIMSSQRAIGSTVGYALFGAILAAWLAATLNPSLESTIPDPTTRAEVTAEVIDQATPAAVAAEVGPSGALSSTTRVSDAAIRSAANDEFVRGMQLASAVAAAMSVGAWVLARRALPRGDVAPSGPGS